jgi:hypothetical protein
MTFIDERGRLFGRLNLIDAVVALVLLVLLPLAYVAYLLFRPAPMTIDSVDPARVTAGQAARVKLHGQNLRPFLRAQVGNTQPLKFLIESPNDGEIVMPDVPAGTYDLTLYDEVMEVARLKNAITVAAPPAGPRVKLQLAGVFFGLDEATARTLATSQKLAGAPASFDIVAAEAPRPDVRRVRTTAGSTATLSVPVPGSWQVPATLRVACDARGDAQQCQVDNTAVLPDATIAVPGGLSFAVHSIRPDASGARVHVAVQFTGRPEVIALMATGDVNVIGGSPARIVSVGVRQMVSGEVSRQVPAGDSIELARTPERLATLEAVLDLIADQSPSGLVYLAEALKPGASIRFETAGYLARGTILRVTPVGRSGQ